MGIIYSCERQKGVIFIVWDGEVTADDWFHHIHKLLSEPDWLIIPRIIADVQTASDTESIGDKEIEAVAALFSEQAEIVSQKRAAVLANQMFGKAKKFETQALRFGASLVVFTALDTACTFLSLNLEYTRQALDGLRLKLRSGG